MLIWRSLSPRAILDCLDYLLPSASRKSSAHQTTHPTESAESQRENRQRIDQATMEIESRL